ncbi:MAG: universal stress protein [Bdellovibrionales bacterium]|nr:universal stress protein [Bdellovibrionales bacterium]
MKNILLTTDLSENSERAFPLAKSFAEKFGASIYVLAVVEDPAQVASVTVMDQPLAYGPDIQKQIIESIKSDINSLAEKYLSGTNFECVVSEGVSAHSSILEFSESHQIDLIIMATQGKAGVKRLFLGSVTEKVSRQAHCPVMLVPPESR